MRKKNLDKKYYIVYKETMKTFKVPSEDKKQMIKEYLDKGLSQSEIARMLGISRQLVRYWVNLVKTGYKR